MPPSAGNTYSAPSLQRTAVQARTTALRPAASDLPTGQTHTPSHLGTPRGHHAHRALGRVRERRSETASLMIKSVKSMPCPSASVPGLRSGRPGLHRRLHAPRPAGWRGRLSSTAHCGGAANGFAPAVPREKQVAQFHTAVCVRLCPPQSTLPTLTTACAPSSPRRAVSAPAHQSLPRNRSSDGCDGQPHPRRLKLPALPLQILMQERPDGRQCLDPLAASRQGIAAIPQFQKRDRLALRLQCTSHLVGLTHGHHGIVPRTD